MRTNPKKRSGQNGRLLWSIMRQLARFGIHPMLCADEPGGSGDPSAGFGQPPATPVPAPASTAPPGVPPGKSVQQLADENRQYRVREQLETSLARHGLPYSACKEAARLLSLDCKFDDTTGRITHARYGSSPEVISQLYLSGDGQHWVTMAQGQNQGQAAGNGAAPQQYSQTAVAGWDIKRAARDVQYNEQWKEADPVGHRAAWKEYLAEVQHRTREFLRQQSGW